MAKSEKDFTKINNPAINNPVLDYMSKVEEETTAEKAPDQAIKDTEPVLDQNPQTNQKAPAGYKMNPEYIELKSQRLQLLIQPSTGKRLKAYAKKQKISTNEAANRAFIEFLENHEK